MTNAPLVEPAAPSEAPDAQVTMRLLTSCPDRPGIVAAVSKHLFESGANILSSQQYSTDPSGGMFFLRTEFSLPAASRVSLVERFGLVAERFDMTWRLWNAADRKRVAVFVSRYDHCLVDLLYRWQANLLDAEIVVVASNHPDLRETVEAAGVPYHHVPVSKERKPQAEAELLDLVHENQCDLVVLARYMQILSPEFLAKVGVPVINIHHSFLPAFAGAGPYEQAKQRGVKLIGATAHYVTEDLDAGPIIEQDVIRVSHADDVPALVRRGAEVERAVLARAVEWHCQDRVLRHGNSTVVF